MFALIVIGALTACSGGSVVSDSATKPQPAQPASSAVPATDASNATPAVAASSPSPSPTMNPVIKQAAAQPGVPVAVPDVVKRPLTPEEMQKALQALPPEVRQRIMGMQKMPQPSPSPSPAKK